ncbi:MAG: DUF4418 family protein [Treponema sp.]|nr:DUF4418 family protein [Treponema sp.]
MKKVRFMDLVLLLVSLILCLGTAFAFSACGPKEDGSWMLCHWAERVVVLQGAICSLLALAKLVCARDGVRLGLGAAIFFNSLAALFVPGRIIPLCKMASMRCHLIMKPSVFTVAILLCLLCLLDAALLFRKVYPRKGH